MGTVFGRAMVTVAGRVVGTVAGRAMVTVVARAVRIGSGCVVGTVFGSAGGMPVLYDLRNIFAFFLRAPLLWSNAMYRAR